MRPPTTRGEPDTVSLGDPPTNGPADVGPETDAGAVHDAGRPWGLGPEGMAAEGDASTLFDASMSVSREPDGALRDAMPSPDARAAALDAGPRDASAHTDTSVLPGPDAAVGRPKLPAKAGLCPDFKEGTQTFLGSRVRLWVGDDGMSKLGPVVFYWYATNSNVDEVNTGLGATVIGEVKQLGGMVVALERTTGVGTNTGNGVWYTGDFAVADEVLACAIEKQVGIDPMHIHAAGFSAGGLQTSWMAYARSNYMASVVPYSGGINGSIATQDASNVVSAMMVHGRPLQDRYIIDFSVTSAAMASDIRSKGGFVVDCMHDDGHAIPAGIGAWSFRFMKDHAYKTKPSPYRSGLPTGFPSYCAVP